MFSMIHNQKGSVLWVWISVRFCRLNAKPWNVFFRLIWNWKGFVWKQLKCNLFFLRLYSIKRGLSLILNHMTFLSDYTKLKRFCLLNSKLQEVTSSIAIIKRFWSTIIDHEKLFTLLCYVKNFVFIHAKSILDFLFDSAMLNKF